MRTTLFAIAGAVLLSWPVHAQPYNVTVAGYSPGGLVSTVAAGMDAALATAYPGSAVTYQTSSGGLANAMMLSQGKVPMAMIADHELPTAWEGRPPFKKPIRDMRMLFRPYVGASRFYITHVIAAKDWANKHGIKTLADIGQKKPPMRLAVNRPGNNDGEVSLSVLKAVGATAQAIPTWGGQVIRTASQEMKSLLLDRRIDILVLGFSYGHPYFKEIETGLEVVMLPISKEVAESVGKEWGGEACQIKQSEYKFLNADSWGPCIGFGVFVNEKMSDELAYNLAKGFYGNYEKIRSAHRMLAKVVSLENMAAPGIPPHHPGVLRYLKEKGLAK